MEKPTRQEVEDLIKYCSDKERCVPMPPKWVEVMRIIEYEKLEKRYQGGLKCLIWHGWSASKENKAKLLVIKYVGQEIILSGANSHP